MFFWHRVLSDHRERCPGGCWESESRGRAQGFSGCRLITQRAKKQVATPQVVSIAQRRLKERASVSCLAASAICSGAI